MFNTLVTAALLLLLLLLLCTCDVTTGIKLDITNEDSIRSVAGTLAYDMMTYYHGNESGRTPGLLDGPPPTPAYLDRGYFWWEAGAMFGSLIDYWYYTGDSTYNAATSQALSFQVGEHQDYLPSNQSLGMGNDDQGFWGMAAMTAAEFNFPNPPADKPQWLALAQAVFNTQAPRIDYEFCGGGLRWQAYRSLNGFDYKNSISNGCFFNIGARLALYTGNDTYAKYAEETWDWMRKIGFMDKNYAIYDGAHIQSNCTDKNPVQFSYNAGVFLLGAATMYNYTNGTELWRNRTESLLNATINTFFPNGIAYEVSCEEALVHCTIDMYAQKAFLTRWMAAATKVAPFTYDAVMKVMKTSAVAAAQQCSGGANGRMCGLSWSKRDKWDGTSGVGQQMAAMEVIQSLLIKKAIAPLTNNTGGTSKGDPNAGGRSVDPTVLVPPTHPDKVGAGILTAVVCTAFTWMILWMTF